MHKNKSDNSRISNIGGMPTNVLIKCQQEIEEILKKNNCFLSVEFVKNRVMEKDVLVYEIVIKEHEQHKT
jgi:hypothetical protein